MSPEIRSFRKIRIFLPVLFLCLPIAASFGQVGGAFGMSASGLAQLLASEDPASALSIEGSALDDTGAYGPSAYYYLARWLDSREGQVASQASVAPIPPLAPATPSLPPGPLGLSEAPGERPAPVGEAEARTRLLCRMAFDRASGILRRESGLFLIDRLRSGEAWDELLSFSSEYIVALGPEWKAERPRLDALEALGKDAETRALALRLGSAYPADSGREADALAYFGAVADLRLGGKSWVKSLRRLLLDRPLSDWTTRAYAFVVGEPRAQAAFSAEETHAIAMRAAVRRKDYEAAYAEALAGPAAAMGPAASKTMIADCGRAFLYSGQLKEGEAKFTAIGWTARYYKARFAMALGRWEEAEGLFKKSATEAPSRTDADAARWYEADCRYRDALATAAAAVDATAKAQAEAAARDEGLAALVEASAAWSNPASFSDLASGLLRDALRARDWSLVEGMSERLASKLAPELRARVAYAAARAIELGADDADASARAAVAVLFAAIADDRAAPLYYRALAAWRAGTEKSFVTLADDPPSSGEPSIVGETESYVAGFASFGLVDLALAEARAHRGDLSDGALRRLAALFAYLGRQDCALRLANELAGRPRFEPRRSDYELLYPRPYLGEIKSLGLGDRFPEDLALGLIRSESAFKTSAVSGAGAIGLSQVMPATAAEQAKALGMTGYDLKTPKDNLAIGLSYFAALLARTEGRPLRAMMAYNAGWSRLRAWAAESEGLPDDLMVEALGIEETRQYCRNILQATVMYGELYYGKTMGQTLGELVGDR